MINYKVFSGIVLSFALANAAHAKPTLSAKDNVTASPLATAIQSSKKVKTKDVLDVFKSPDIKRSFSLNTQLIPGHMTTFPVANFILETQDLIGLAFDFGANHLPIKNAWTRFAYAIVFDYILAGPATNALQTSNRVFGLASRMNAYGYKHTYLSRTRADIGDNYYMMLGRTMLDNYKSLLFMGPQKEVDANGNETNYEVCHAAYASRIKDGTGYAEKFDRQYAKDILDQSNGQDEKNLDIILAGARINAQTYIARIVEDSLWYADGGHRMRITNYRSDKMALAGAIIRENIIRKLTSYCPNYNHRMEIGDWRNIVKAYAAKGIQTSSDELATYSLFSYLLSAHFYYSWFIDKTPSFIGTGSSYVRTPVVNGFRLPNLGTYFTTKGISVQLSTGYGTGTWKFPFAVEFITRGESTVEWTIGIDKKFPTLYGLGLHVDAFVNSKALSGAAYVSLSPSNYLSGRVGMAYMDPQNLFGERNISSLADGKTKLSFYGQISLTY